MLIKSLDFHMIIEDIIAEGDKVWACYTFTGTHVGDFHGLAPTGEKFTESVVYIFHTVDSKLVESLEVSNPLDLLRQLGIIEYTEKTKKLIPKEI
jgi:predicted ester cyclase